MDRNCYVFAFLGIWGLLCVSAVEEGRNSLVKEQVKVEGGVQILRLPSEEESSSQAIPWEQSPIQIHSLRFPLRPRPMVGKEKEMEMEHLPNFQQGRFRPVRFRFGRPGGCHGKFRQALMPREDPSQLQILRRMGMGHQRHAHPYLFPSIEDLRDDEKTSATAFRDHLRVEREGMGFEMQSERGFEGGFGEREEEEREGPWMAWLRSIFH